MVLLPGMLKELPSFLEDPPSYRSFKGATRHLSEKRSDFFFGYSNQKRAIIILENIIKYNKSLQIYGRIGFYLNQIPQGELIDYFEKGGKLKLILLSNDLIKERKKILKLEEIREEYPEQIGRFDINLEEIEKENLNLKNKTFLISDTRAMMAESFESLDCKQFKGFACFNNSDNKDAPYSSLKRYFETLWSKKR